MGRLSKEQESFLTYLDSMLMMIDRYGSLASLDGFNYTISPLKLLLDILKKFGVGYDELIEWLSSKIVYITPILEIAVKGILLAKLKKNIDCNLDPQIPYYFRELIDKCEEKAFQGNFIFGERGIEVDLNSIDYYGLLYNSPMSDRSHYNYFGTKCYYTSPQINDEKFYNYADAVKECQSKKIDSSTISKTAEIDSVYELVRAKDMNAFLWFVIHKAKFLNSIELGNDLIKSSQDSVIKVLQGTSETTVPLGQPYHQISNGGVQYSVMGLCMKSTYNQTENKDIKENSTSFSSDNSVSDSDVATQIQKNKNNISSCDYTIVPTTNIWNGINWYVDRSRYFDFQNKTERNYEKEFALFRLTTQIKNDNFTNKLIFTIKPKPTIIKPEIETGATITNLEGKKKLDIKIEGDSPLSFHKIVFDADGDMDHHGKYSVVIGGKEKEDGQWTVYPVKDFNNINNDYSTNDIKLYLNKKSGGYFLHSDSGDDIKSVLYECYPGLTVYEFNYDFIMSVQLFDPTVISARLIEELTNIKLGISYKKNTTDYKMRISEVVKKIVETNGYESSDCFYTFSNDEYDTMLEKSELKRANLYPFQDEMHRATNVSYYDVYGILNEYDSNATLEENISVINRAITKAAATISAEALPEDKYSLELNFITQAIEMLASILIESLITPKMLLILLINKKMMGEELPKKWSIDDILREFQVLIMQMVSEIFDLIITELWNYVKEKIGEILANLAKILAMEQIEYYTRLLSLALKACSFKLPKNPNLASNLDYVEYADIDENDKPVTNEC